MEPFERRGRWVVKVKSGAGVWRQHTMPRGASLEDARQLRLKLELDAMSVRLTGEARLDAGQTVGELVEWWLRTPAAARLVDLASVRSRLRTWVAPALGGLLPAEVTPARVRELVADVGAVRAPKTANHVLADVRRLVGAAQDSSLWPPTHDPTIRVRPLPVGPVERPTLTLQEARALVEGSEGQGRVARALALFLGLRKGEVLGMPSDLVDLEAGVVFVHWSNGRPTTKNGRWRWLAIPAFLRPVLEPWRRHHAGTTHLLPSPTDGRWNKDVDLCGPLRDDLVRLGIRTASEAKGLRFHDLRHTWATLAEEAGVPYEARARVLGHANRSVTERYTHRSADRLRTLLEQVYPRPNDGSSTT